MTPEPADVKARQQAVDDLIDTMLEFDAEGTVLTPKFIIHRRPETSDEA